MQSSPSNGGGGGGGGYQESGRREGGKESGFFFVSRTGRDPVNITGKEEVREGRRRRVIVGEVVIYRLLRERKVELCI